MSVRLGQETRSLLTPAARDVALKCPREMCKMLAAMCLDNASRFVNEGIHAPHANKESLDEVIEVNKAMTTLLETVFHFAYV